MNNHLVPEQRVDKNGRLNTKHVRATKTPLSSTKVPAPKLTATKGTQSRPLTAGQKRQKKQDLGITHILAEGELAQRLGLNPYALHYEIQCSDEEVYSVLSATNNGAASALIVAGHRSSESAASYLEEIGFKGHVEDRSAHCEEALARRISPQRFILATDYLRKYDSEQYMDAVETYGASKQIASRLESGAINYSDVEEITLKRVRDCKDELTLTQALQWLATGNASFTASELGQIMDKHPANLRDALKFCNKYGADFVTSLRYLDVGYDEHLEKQEINRELAKKMLTYGDQVTVYEIEKNIYKEPLRYEKMDRYFNSGLDISHAAEDDCTDEQLEAIKQGIAPGVSGGWL